MKNIDLLFLLILFPIIGFSQITPMLNAMDIETMGEVIKVEIDYLKPKIIDDSLYYLHDCGFFGRCMEQVLYNEQGKIITINQYRKSRNLDKLEIEYIWQYHYNGEKLDSIVRKFTNDEKLKRGFRELKFIYEYVSDSIKYEIREGFIGSRKKKYKITETAEFTKTESIDETTGTQEIHFYDHIGRIKQYEFYNPYDTLINRSVNKYKSDEDKIPSVNYRIDLSDNKVTIMERTLDEKGNEIKTTTKDSNGKVLSDLIYEYDYDDRGNWIEKRRIANRNKKLLFVKKRTIEYKE